MPTNRREFIEHLGATAMLGALPLSTMPSLVHALAEPQASAEEFDLSWTTSLKGKKHKAVFDCTEVESGYGVWRMSIWETQYQSVLGAKPSEMGKVLVLRHNALVLGFQQDFWDANGIGAMEKVTHPITQQSTEKNPALLSAARNEVPTQFDAFALPRFIERGGIVLACNVALQFFSAALAQKAGITVEEARKRAVAALVPGVKLQPSGVFACVRAQQEGCAYVKASA
jgi:intracellular sulfur oxidation DsrE/DsrF family protein